MTPDLVEQISQPINVFSKEQIANARPSPMPSVFPRSGEGEFARVIIDRHDCVIKELLGGNAIDANYQIMIGGALGYLAKRIDASLIGHNLVVSGPEVLYQDDRNLICSTITAGASQNLARDFSQVHSALLRGGKELQLLAMCYGKDPAMSMPFDRDLREILLDLLRTQDKEVKGFNALFPRAASPRGEVATPIETHFLVQDFNVGAAGTLEMKLVLIDLK